jgi:Transposase DDE domain
MAAGNVAGAQVGGAQLEAELVEVAAGIAAVRPTGPGRPPLVAATVLGASLASGGLRGTMSQLGGWRLVVDQRWWQERHVWVTAEAVSKRLAPADPRPLAALFAPFTPLLAARVESHQDRTLAPFATDVVVLDETTLEPVARARPAWRDVPPGEARVRTGQLAGVFDVRRPLWRILVQVPTPQQNEQVAARDLVAELAPGTLILADRGYFSVAWCDELTAGGDCWLSRKRAKTTYRGHHVFYEQGATCDGLGWLGKHRADRAKHLGRLVAFRHGRTTHAYLTNGLDPHQFSVAAIATVYARRWDLELAVKLVKRELGLAMLWSATPAVIAPQGWAVLLLAPILQVLRLAVAAAAGGDRFDVALPWLSRYLPQYAAYHDEPLAAVVADGPKLGFIRSSRRVKPLAPAIPVEALTLPPPALVTTQVPRYAGRKCGPHRTDRRN